MPIWESPSLLCDNTPTGFGRHSTSSDVQPVVLFYANRDGDDDRFLDAAWWWATFRQTSLRDCAATGVIP
ncbi:MAG: hypothetical protein QOE94_2295 [Mycobacterium sp.]|jgi:hypothetical protein|nr:hypothetical protein [Mycobacterium sp.]MDT7721284.1 hypothetical protein [Mycobacterium sp.]